MERPVKDQPFNSETDNPLNEGPLMGSILFANDSLLAMKWEHTLYVFDPATGKEINVLHGTDRDEMKPIAFSKDNKLIVVNEAGATTEMDEINRAYDLASGTVSQSPAAKALNAMAPAVYATDFADIGLQMESRLDHPYRVLGTNVVLSAENVNGTFVVKIENSESKAVTFLPVQYRKVPYADLARGGKRIAVVSLDGVAQLWRLSRPDAWWGVAWLPEFWLTALLSCAFAWSLWRDRSKVSLR
jgi:hypothetical protein